MLSNTSHLIERFAQFRCCLLTAKKGKVSPGTGTRIKKNEENVKELDLSTRIGITGSEYKLSVSRSLSASARPDIRIHILVLRVLASIRIC